jgi:hypothetical protein
LRILQGVSTFSHLRPNIEKSSDFEHRFGSHLISFVGNLGQHSTQITPFADQVSTGGFCQNLPFV